MQINFPIALDSLKALEWGIREEHDLGCITHGKGMMIKEGEGKGP